MPHFATDADTGQMVASVLTSRDAGDGLRSPTDCRQATEVAFAANVLNHVLELGRPEYIRIA